MGLKIGGQVEKVNWKELSYKEFVDNYLLKNQPVVLTGLMDDWKACQDWVLDNGRPNLKFISTHFGNSKVQVSDCDTREFTDQKRMEMSVSEFIEHWLEGCGNSSANQSDGKYHLYLKDWHFVKEYPEYVAYTTPLIFCDDWLNLYLDKFRMHTDRDVYEEKNEISCSDYRFVYMGAKGTWTPLHADVFRSYSWSANVCGKKQWYFLSPCQCHLVFDRNMKNSVYNILENVDDKQFPAYEKAIWWECIQEQNEIIFVPSGWYHQVHNLEDTISINHNWFNAYNLPWVWALLLRDYREAKVYIEDIKDICDDFEGLCQRNLAANTGMNFYDFFIFLLRFSFANMVQLYRFARDHENFIWASSRIVENMVFNLECAWSIALKIKSKGLTENIGISINYREALEDDAFRDLCAVLGRTYRTLHEQCDISNDLKQTVGGDDWDLDLLDFLASSICGPDDLVKCIENTFTKLGIGVTGKNPLLGELDRKVGGSTVL